MNDNKVDTQVKFRHKSNDPIEIETFLKGV
jgi:hypothetical protein